MTGENDLNEKSPAGNFLQKKFHAGLIPDKGIVFVKLSSMCCVVLCCVVLCSGIVPGEFYLSSCIPSFSQKNSLSIPKECDLSRDFS